MIRVQQRPVPIPSSLITLLLGMALVLAGLWVGYNVSMMPIDARSNAPVYDALFKVLFSIGTVLFLGIVGVLIFSLVRFRRRSGDSSDGAAIEGNLPLEIVWTAIPAVVVLFVGIYSYDIYERMGGMTPLNDHGAMHTSQPAGDHHHHGGAHGSKQAVLASSSHFSAPDVSLGFPQRNGLGARHVPQARLLILLLRVAMPPRAIGGQYRHSGKGAAAHRNANAAHRRGTNGRTA